MTSASGAKGYRFEKALVDYLREWFPNVDRRVKHAFADTGDVEGIPGVVIEAKDAKRLELGGWWRETEREQANAGAEFGILVVKRPGQSSPGEAFVVVPLRVFVPWLLVLMKAKRPRRRGSPGSG